MFAGGAYSHPGISDWRLARGMVCGAEYAIGLILNADYAELRWRWAAEAAAREVTKMRRPSARDVRTIGQRARTGGTGTNGWLPERRFNSKHPAWRAKSWRGVERSADTSVQSVWIAVPVLRHVPRGWPYCDVQCGLSRRTSRSGRTISQRAPVPARSPRAAPVPCSRARGTRARGSSRTRRPPPTAPRRCRWR